MTSKVEVNGTPSGGSADRLPNNNPGGDTFPDQGLQGKCHGMLLTSRAKRVAISHVAGPQQQIPPPPNDSKLGLARRAQRIVTQRVDHPPNPQASKRALNSKPVRVAIPVEEQHLFLVRKTTSYRDWRMIASRQGNH